MKSIILIMLVTVNCYCQTFTQFNLSDPTSSWTGNFGDKVDIFNNEIIVVKNSLSRDTPVHPSRVYLFNLDGNQIQEVNSFYPADAIPADRFGNSISICNDNIAVSAPYHGANDSRFGAVYIYRKVNGVYEFSQKIMSPDGMNFGDLFGWYVKIYNDQLFIIKGNSVYIYNNSVGSWVFAEKIIMPGSSTSAAIAKIEVENEKLVAFINNGWKRLFTYHLENGNWIYKHNLDVASNVNKVTDFCLSDGQLFTITMPIDFTNNDVEQVTVMSEENSNWITTSNFTTIPDHQVYSVIKVNHDKLFLGSSSYVDINPRKYPVSYYKLEGNNWNYQTSLYSPTTVLNDFFGAALASHGDNFIIGAPLDGTPKRGRAYYLNLNTLSTKTFDENRCKLYPNPTQDIVKISNIGKYTVQKIEVYNLTGNLLLESANSDIISLDSFSNGIYFIKLNYLNSGNETFKIIKN